MFCAKDVCNALGYGNPQQAVRLHVENEDKGMLKISTPGGKQNPPTSTVQPLCPHPLLQIRKCHTIQALGNLRSAPKHLQDASVNQSISQLIKTLYSPQSNTESQWLKFSHNPHSKWHSFHIFRIL